MQSDILIAKLDIFQHNRTKCCQVQSEIFIGKFGIFQHNRTEDVLMCMMVARQNVTVT